MRTIIACSLLTISFQVWAAPLITDAAVNTSRQTQTPYAITEREANYRVWQRVTAITLPSGHVVHRTNSYTELATGMHYKNGQGEWIESKDEIEIITGVPGAVARQGQHKVLFPPNVYNGVIEMETPDGVTLKARPLGISYFDGKNSVLISELKESVGRLMPSKNQIVYPDAFTDFKVDLVCTYRKSGFECDVVFRQKPPGPEEYGLNPRTARLQVLTEYFDTPEPEKESLAIDQRDGLQDTKLKFGCMTFAPGKAFSVQGDDQNQKALVAAQPVSAPQAGLATGAQGRPIGTEQPVYKTWNKLEGRTFLIEEVPYRDAETQLRQLTVIEKPKREVAGNNKIRQASAKHVLPALRPVRKSTETIEVANADILSRPGYVLDYVTLNSSQTNYTFRGDTTYYITEEVNLYGSTTLEGGTVIKYRHPGEASTYCQIIVWGEAFRCQTSAYRPAVFTTKDDDSVGETISGSTGMPAMNIWDYRGYITIFPDNSVFQHARMNYGASGVVMVHGWPEIRDVQFSHTRYPIHTAYGFVSVRNILINDAEIAFSANYSETYVEHATIHRCTQLYYDYSTSTPPTITNSLFICLTNFNVAFASEHNVTNSSDAGVFQSVGAGNHYLADNSPYRNAGATNINKSFRSELSRQTTYPPFILSNVTVSANTTLSPQAQRDTDLPDLGYHYNPVDFITRNFAVTNATLTITNGTVIAYYNDTGIWLQDNAEIVSVGQPQNPNRFICYTAVQEESVKLGTSDPGDGFPINSYRFGSVGSPATFRFTHFSRPTGGNNPYDFYISSANWLYSTLSIRDCEFDNGEFYCAITSNLTVNINNNRLSESYLYFAHSGGGGSSVSFYNNLFRNNSATFSNSGSTPWVIKDNVFDNCSASRGNIANTTPDHGYNAYINAGSRLNPTNAHDTVLSSFDWQIGPLGNFYQPTNSVLINTGSRNANDAGLYHFNTLINSVKETNSVVDIGYHYVVTNRLLTGSVSQSSTLNDYGLASHAIDGETDGDYNHRSITHTLNDTNAWWEIDFGDIFSITSIKVWNRTDCCGDRLSNFYVFVSNDPFTSKDLTTTLAQSGVSNYYFSGTAGTSETFTIGRTGHYVRVQLSSQNYLSLAEVQIFPSAPPFDSDSDGMPDYFEDANGNGTYDSGSGETDWKTYNSPNGLSGSPALQVFTPMK